MFTKARQWFHFCTTWIHPPPPPAKSIFEPNSNITLLFTPRSSKWSPSLVFSNEMFALFFPFIPCGLLSSSADSTWQAVQIIQLPPPYKAHSSPTTNLLLLSHPSKSPDVLLSCLVSNLRALPLKWGTIPLPYEITCETGCDYFSVYVFRQTTDNDNDAKHFTFLIQRT